MDRLLKSAFLFLCAVSSVLAQSQVQFAVITHRNTPIKAGPNVPDAQLFKAHPGEVVQFFGYRGEFAEIAIAGGVEAYVMEKRGERVFVELDELGNGRVTVKKLTLRPHANQDWPPLATLKANDRLVVLSREAAGWLKVMAPDGVHVFAHKNYVRVSENDGGMAADFARLDAARRRSFLEKGELSKKSLAKRDLDADLRARFERADSMLRGAEDLTMEQLASVRGEFSKIQRDAPANSPLGRAAEERVAYIQGKEDAHQKFRKADARIKQLELERERREIEYKRSLETFRRTRVEKREKAKAESENKSRFLRLGIGRLHKVYLGRARTATWVLGKGAEKRYVLSSDRYDLSEFRDKKIGITKWEMLDREARFGIPRVEVTRLEVLE